MRWTKAISIGTLLIAVLSAAACGRQRPIDLHDPNLPQPEVLIPRSYTNNQIRIDPPPADATPGVSMFEAMSIYESHPQYQDVLADPDRGPTDIQLGLFSDDVFGEIQPDDSVLPEIQDALAWIITSHGVRYIPSVGGPPGSNRTLATVDLSDVVAAIDAQSGQILGAFNWA